MFKITVAGLIDPYLIEELMSCFDVYDRDQIARYIFSGDEAYTLWGGKDVLGVMGVTMVSDKVMYGWSLLSPKVVDYRLAFAKAMREMIIKGMSERGVVRFFTYVDEDNKIAVRQNEWNGLSIEGLLRKNGSRGQNQYVMSKVVE